MRRVLVAGFVGLLGVAACGRSYATAAQEEFTKEFSCPKDRVAVTARTDLNAYDLTAGEREKPPAEVAADPGRLAEWKKKQASIENGYKGFHVFFVRGCEHETYYLCSDATANTGEQVVVCTKAQHPPGGAAK